MKKILDEYGIGMLVTLSAFGNGFMDMSQHKTNWAIFDFVIGIGLVVLITGNIIMDRLENRS